MRQFVSEAEPDAQGKLPLSPEDMHYFTRVLRLQNGDPVPVRWKTGKLQNMRLSGEFLVTAEEGETEGNAFLEKYRFSLLQFLPKAPKFDLIIRGAAEVGVRWIVPIQGEYSPPAGAGKTERWRKIVKEARQQCGSPVATEVLPVHRAEEAAAWWKNEGGPGFLLDEKGGPPPGYYGTGDAMWGGDRFSIAVGSEGGIAPLERSLLLEAGFLPLHFPINILRCETAAVYGLSSIQTALMGTLENFSF